MPGCTCLNMWSSRSKRDQLTHPDHFMVSTLVDKYQSTVAKGRGPKKNTYFLWSFAKPGGGGSARVVKNHTAFLKKVFFQRACRIILVPPKHVLHLVWSPYVIYTAIRTALKVACKARILGKRRSISKNKKIKFWNGTKRKICFTHLWSYFRKKK